MLTRAMESIKNLNVKYLGVWQNNETFSFI